MSDSRRQNHATASALDATIKRNEEVVRRSRKTRDRSFLKRLGLSVPVTPDDVKKAYYARAKETHPDHRGDSREFMQLQEAFDAALAYAETNGKRLPWLGEQLPLYAAQRDTVGLIDKWGGRTEVVQLGWLEDTVGEDFAQLADRLVEIDLTGCDFGDAQMRELFSNIDGLRYLESLVLADTAVTDESVLDVMKAAQLRRLDLRGTGVSFGMRRQLAKLQRFDQVAGASRLRAWFGQ